jgi:CubicO group peptidase (beta-lactamase class C family)
MSGDHPEDRLEAEIPALMAGAQVPGLAVALVRSGSVGWARGFGVKCAGSPEPVAPDTVFQAASLSKPVFAYAVLKLVERGALDLDAPLTAYLPARYVPDDPLLDRITARRVLCHTTGWPNWRPEGQPLRRDGVPGERFGYSGEGYGYLQRVVERLTGQGLDSFVRRGLFEPLGMTRSSYAWAAPDVPAVAASHNRLGKPRTRYTGSCATAASSLHTTVADFARFLTAMLASVAEPWMLSPDGLAEMVRPQVPVGDAVAWGLGWGVELTDRGPAFWHWGDNPGYKSFALAIPAARAAAVIMANGDGGLALWEPIVRLTVGGDHPAFAWLASFYGVPNLAAAARERPSSA